MPDLVDEHGGDIDRTFRAAGVRVELASEPERILPMRNYLRLLEIAARETGDEHFGVSMAERLEINDLGPFGRLMTGAPTLRRAIETCCRLIHSFSPALRCWLEVERGTAHWHYQITGLRSFHEGRRLDSEQTLLLFRTLIRLAAGPSWQPDKVLLEQPTRHQLHAFQTRFGAPARCVEGACGLVFPRHLLDLPMTYGKSLGGSDRRVLLTRLASSAPGETFLGSVKAIIKGQLCGGYPEISAIADSSGLSVRTFQRRLAEEGMTYSGLVTVGRRELAQELLVDPSRSQIDISQSLGYSDTGNFSRAFKRWSGVTPSEFRRSSLLVPA